MHSLNKSQHGRTSSSLAAPWSCGLLSFWAGSMHFSSSSPEVSWRVPCGIWQLCKQQATQQLSCESFGTSFLLRVVLFVVWREDEALFFRHADRPQPEGCHSTRRSLLVRPSYTTNSRSCPGRGTLSSNVTFPVKPGSMIRIIFYLAHDHIRSFVFSLVFSMAFSPSHLRKHLWRHRRKRRPNAERRTDTSERLLLACKA